MTALPLATLAAAALAAAADVPPPAPATLAVVTLSPFADARAAQLSPACPAAAGGKAATDADLKLDAALNGIVYRQVQKKAAGKLDVRAGTAPAAPAIVVSGCFTKVDPGNAAERMVGMNLGASRLAAHVQVFAGADAAGAPIDEFDVEAKGGALLPPLGPIGLAVHGVKEMNETLSADARKLGDQIAAHLEKDAARRPS